MAAGDIISALPQAQGWDPYYQEAATQYGVDVDLLRAQDYQESRFNPQAVSPAGAQGLAQIMPTTAPGIGVSNAFTPKQAIFGQARLLRENMDRYGDPALAVAAYHGGTDMRNWGPKTHDYVQKVAAYYAQLRAAQAQGQNGLPDTSANPQPYGPGERRAPRAQVDSGDDTEDSSTAAAPASGSLSFDDLIPKAASGAQSQQPLSFDDLIPAGQSQGRADINALLQPMGGVGPVLSGAGRAIQQSGKAETSQALDVIDKIDAGEPVPDVEDVVGYRALKESDPAAAAKMKADLEKQHTELAIGRPTALTAAGQAVTEFGKKQFPVEPQNEGLQTRVAGMLGGLPAVIGSAVAGGVVGGPGGSIAGGAAAIWNQSYDSTYNEAINKGLTPDQADSAARTNATGQAALMTVPLGRLVQAVPVPFREGALATLAHIGKQGIEFGSFNSAARFLENYLAQQTFDPERKLTEGVGDSALEGTLAGMIVPFGKAVGRDAAGFARLGIDRLRKTAAGPAPAPPERGLPAPPFAGETIEGKAEEPSAEAPAKPPPVRKPTFTINPAVQEGEVAPPTAPTAAPVAGKGPTSRADAIRAYAAENLPGLVGEPAVAPAAEQPAPGQPEPAPTKTAAQQELEDALTRTAGRQPLPAAEATPPGSELSETTPEPVTYIGAQIDALKDPDNPKDAVFIAKGTPVPDLKGVKDAETVKRPEGTLVTTNKTKADVFKDAHALSDDLMATILDYPQTKSEAIASGHPVVVQGKDDAGNVVAETLASPDGVPKAAQVIGSQAPHVEVTTPDLAQQERAEATEAASAAEPTTEAPLAVPGRTEVEHVTKKGKTLTGYIRTDLKTLAAAKEVDQYAFKKGDGYFVRKDAQDQADKALAGLDAELSKAKPAEAPPPAKAGWNEIGTNRSGLPLFEDENGVRSYSENGVRVTETVGMRPTREGMKVDVAPVANKHRDFLTSDEIAAHAPPAVEHPGLIIHSLETGKETHIQPPGTVPPATEAPKAEEKPGYGAGNKTFTADAAAKARERLKAKLGRLHSGFDPEMMLDGLTLAGFHIEAGARKFGEFARAILDDLGDAARPYLRQWYNAVRDHPGFDTAGMTPHAEMDAELQKLAAVPTSEPEGKANELLHDTLPPGNEGTGPEAVHGPLPHEEAGRAPEAEGPGGERPVAAGAGPGAEEGERGRGEPGGPEGGGGDREGDLDRLPEAGGPEHGGAAGRPPEERPPTPEALETAADFPGQDRDKFLAEFGPDANVRGTNHIIGAGGVSEGRGPMQKARDNLAAIELAKRLLADKRTATKAEQEILAKYVGWGGLKNAFERPGGGFAKGFEDIGPRLRALLTPEEYLTASRSTQYAHYTAEHVIRSMWDAVRLMGFEGGDVFEPGMGVGHFNGMMPPDLATKTRYEGVEMDHLTADIASLLYPESGVRQADFTRMPVPENSFDLAIGNPPFSDTVIKADPKYSSQGFMLHDYFFAKSLDSVRPGGLLAFVTSAGTMNKMDDAARLYMAERAEFVGGVRLPSTAFKRNAGTEVTTDILFFKKRPGGPVTFDPGEEPGWTKTVIRTLPDAEGNPTEGHVSNYFSQHPEMVLGKEGFFDKLYKGRYGVHAEPNQNLETELKRALDTLPRDIMTPPPTPEQLAALDFASGQVKDGSFYIGPTGALMQYRDGAGRIVLSRGKGVKGGITKGDRAKTMLLIPIRDALRDVFRNDLAEDADGGAKARAALNKTYDAFVKKYGPINKEEHEERRPTIIQQESARLEERQEALDRDEHYINGSFDPGPMLAQGKTVTEIAQARQAMRNDYAARGQKFIEGEFEPEEMPDVIIVRYPNIGGFQDDPESYRLRSIESYSHETGKAEKKDIFRRNILTREKEPEIRSANDGVLWSLNKFGRLDVDAIAKKLGKGRPEVIEELGDFVYRIPGTQDTYQSRDEYLSGDVVSKLAVARKEADSDRDLRRNVEALEAVQPQPLSPSEIRIMMGMPWIPADVVEDFVSNHLLLGNASIAHSEALGRWNVQLGNQGDTTGRGIWSAERISAGDMLDHALNRTPARIYFPRDREGRTEFDPVGTQAANDLIDKVKDEFTRWVGADVERADGLARIYNDRLNRTVLRKYDGSYLTTPGIADDFSWRPHQRGVVSRIIQTGNTYMAHAVGAGKTSAMIGAGMEMRRLGLVKKPMYVVPNHMLTQFTKEFYQQYPTARISVADERNFHTDRRKQFVANVAQDDLDAVIITHSAFKKIPIGDRFLQDMIDEELENFREALEGVGTSQADRYTRGKLEAQIEKLEQKLRDAQDGKRDQTMTFEEMGTDFLFVDEAHLFRKLSFATQQNSMKGITPDGSDAAWDLFTKIRYLESKTPGRSAVLASGTPVTNTMGELYTISRYLQRKTLEDLGLSHFDSWAQSFGDTKTALEETAAGTYAPVTRFSKFMNMPELYKMVAQVMDIVTPAELGQYVTRPQLAGGTRQLHMAPRTDFLDRYQAHLAERMHAIADRKGPPEKGDDILLSVINDGRLAAIDPRFMEKAQSEATSKLNLMIDNAAKIHFDTKDTQFYDPGTGYKEKSFRGPATQMIFANLGVNGAGETGFSTYSWIKEALRRKGIDPKEIAFIGDYKSHLARQNLFNDMNAGKVRILIGSTQKMGTGVNAQRRLIAMHNLDPLWYPADDEQRVGRILRQGNHNPEVHVHDYTTKGTYDSAMWNMMGRKARFIEQFFRGDPDLRDMEDLGEASMFEQASAMSTTDERIIDLTQMRQDLDKAERRKSAFEREQYNARNAINTAVSSIDYGEQRIKALEGQIERRPETRGDKFQMTVGDKVYAKRADAWKALENEIAVATAEMGRGTGRTIGAFGPFPLVAEKDARDRMSYNLQFAKKDGAYLGSSAYDVTPRGIVQAAEEAMANLEDRVQDRRREIAAQKNRIEQAKVVLKQTFDGQPEINRLRDSVRMLEDTLKAEAAAKEAARKGALPPAEPQTRAPYDPGIKVGDRITGSWIGPSGYRVSVTDERVHSPVFPQGSREQSGWALDNGETLPFSDRYRSYQAAATTDEARAALTSDVQALLARIAPGAHVQSWPTITGPGGVVMHGAYLHRAETNLGTINLIAWSQSAPDPMSTGRHEVMHYLRQGGFIRPKEWNAIAQAAEAKGWRKQYRIDERYPNLDEDRRIEEAVAERYADWGSGKQADVTGIVARVFDSLSKLRSQIATMVRRAFGRNITPEEFFRMVEAGEVGRREPQNPDMESGPAFQAPGGEDEHTEIRRQYEERMGKLRGMIVDNYSAAERTKVRNALAEQAEMDRHGAESPDSGLARLNEDQRALADMLSRTPESERAWLLATDTAGPVSKKAMAAGMFDALTGRAKDTTLAKIGDSFVKTLSPTARSAGAKQIGHVIVRHTAEQAQSYAQSYERLDALRHAMSRLSPEEQDDFTHRMETGQEQPTPAMQDVAKALRKTYDDWAKKIQSLGKGYLDNAIEGYMAHIYRNYPEWRAGLERDEEAEAERERMMQAMGQSKRPLRGSGNFLKKRVFETLQDAMQAGLEPVSHNPLDVALIKLREMQKFYHGTRMADAIKEGGLAKWVPVEGEGQARGAGWVKLDDSVFQPRIVGEGNPAGFGRLEPGNWYAPEEVGRVFNHYAAKGLGADPLFSAVRASGNALNQLQLGMSFFHATFVCNDVLTSTGALGLQELTRGQVGKGLSHVALGTPLAGPYTVYTRYQRGKALARALLDPENAPPELKPIMEAALTGGARLNMQQFYRSNASGSFFRTLKDFQNPGGVLRDVWSTVREHGIMAPWHLTTRLLETINEPIMGKLVPNAKLGIFADMAQSWLERHPNATPEAQAEAFTRIQDSVDNRMGQMVYDNVFWHKTLKDMAFVMFRSVGWNLGTIRELGGAVWDTASGRGVKQLLKGHGLTERMAYAMFMPVPVMIAGAILTYLRTGRGPEELMDYFFPPDSTGGNRIIIPSYIKDVIEYSHAPLQTLLNKMHPLASMASQIYQNKDYYGGTIYNPSMDNPVHAYAEYVLNQALPFSVRSAMRQNDTGGTNTDKALSFFGFQAAPKSIVSPEKSERWQQKQDMAGTKRRMKEQGRVSLPHLDELFGR